MLDCLAPRLGATPTKLFTNLNGVSWSVVSVRVVNNFDCCCMTDTNMLENTASTVKKCLVSKSGFIGPACVC